MYDFKFTEQGLKRLATLQKLAPVRVSAQRVAEGQIISHLECRTEQIEFDGIDCNIIYVSGFSDPDLESKKVGGLGTPFLVLGEDFEVFEV